MSLPKNMRLVKKSEINEVFTKGMSVKGSFFFIKYKFNKKEGISRFLVTIPNKFVPLATKRNLFKRQIISILKDIKPKNSLDISIVISKKIEKLSKQDIEEMGEKVSRIK